MDARLLDVLRCPFCGSALDLVDSEALDVRGDEIHAGVLGCECCAYPVVDGIPVLLADEPTRSAMHALEAGSAEDALLELLGVAGDEAHARSVRSLLGRADATYRDGLACLCDDAEGTWFLHRFSDPGYVAAEAMLRAIAQCGWPVEGRVLDLCGGSGHLARVLEAGRPTTGADGAGGDSGAEAAAPATRVVADLWFWKLWLGRRFVVPGAEAVCCDANSPLPFARDAFSMVLLADAFPYVWHKRLLAEEMMRLVGTDGAVVMPHLHSALGDNFSAGDTLSPAAYAALFEPLGARLFSDAALLDDLLERGVVDLRREASPDGLGDEPTLTLVASARTDLFRRFEMSPAREVRGVLTVNPLYRVERNGRSATLTLSFPSSEYEAEFAACRRYMPERVTVEADLSSSLRPEAFGSRYAELRDRRVLIDAPERYLP